MHRFQTIKYGATYYDQVLTISFGDSGSSGHTRGHEDTDCGEGPL